MGRRAGLALLLSFVGLLNFVYSYLYNLNLELRKRPPMTTTRMRGDYAHKRGGLSRASGRPTGGYTWSLRGRRKGGEIPGGWLTAKWPQSFV